MKGGNVQQFTANMKEAKNLSTLKKAIVVFKPVMMHFQQKHSAYKFRMAVDVVFHNAVDPAVVIHPPVTLTLEMVAVYADDPPLNNIKFHRRVRTEWFRLGFFKLCFLATVIMAP